jgi:geranylgeranyl diphosphate synthase type II
MPKELAELRDSIEQRLNQYLAAEEGVPRRLNDAIRYSVLAPGKRLRPLLTLIACKTVGGDWRPALPAACAVEFIHVYSLIHDDLPAMDDDDLRRGQPTCHKQFDEATAILAGDSLQMLAIEVMCRDLPAEVAGRCCHLLARAAGRSCLVGGQSDDLAAEGRFADVEIPKTAEFLSQIHRRKTGALIQASLQLGGIVAGADSEQIRILGHFGQSIGLAFQIIDDCLDVQATPEQMGKNTRKDTAHGKLTYPNLIGLEASRRMADELICDAVQSLAVFEDRAGQLEAMAEFIVQRRN